MVGVERYCEKCGAALEPGTRFCMTCGAPIAQEGAAQAAPAPAQPQVSAPRFCEQCGAPLETGQRACRRCGAPAPAVASAPAAPAQVVSPAHAAPVQAQVATQAPAAKKPGFLSGLFGRKKAAEAAAPAAQPAPTAPQPVSQPAPAPASPAGTCANCGAPLTPGYLFCEQCGTRVAAAAAEPAPAVAEPAPATPATSTFTSGPASPYPRTEASRTPTAPTAPAEVLTHPARPFVERRSTGERLELDLPATLGKGSAATTIIEGNDAVSRAHARVTRGQSGFLVEDLGSTNGTFVDGERLAEGTRVPLRDGAALRLADEELVFHTS